MPAWQASAAQTGGGFMGVKIVTVFPDNATRRKASVQATYVLMAGDSGEALATLDGETLSCGGQQQLRRWRPVLLPAPTRRASP